MHLTGEKKPIEGTSGGSTKLYVLQQSGRDNTFTIRPVDELA